ncbi:MAG: hypothetical protein ACK5RR_03200 [Acidobacteriota bacterium]
MKRIDQLTITREHLQAAASLAQKCSSASVRTRVLVTRAAILSIREHLEDYYGFETSDGRAVQTDFAELLDLADFEAGGWQVEVRVMTDPHEQHLLVPTMPILVGALADLYLAVTVERSLGRVEIIGYADQADLAMAELTRNGLMASLPRHALRSARGLSERLATPRPIDDWRIDFTETWQRDVLRVADQLAAVIGKDSGGDLTGPELQRLVEVVRDEVWRIYGDRIPASGLSPLLARLVDYFGLAGPVPTLGDARLHFRNSLREEQLAAREAIQEAFLRDQLKPGERIALYRRLLTDHAAFDQLRLQRAALDRLTSGRHQAPATQIARQAPRRRLPEALFELPPERGDRETAPLTENTDDGASLPTVTANGGPELDLFDDRYHQILVSLYAWFPGLVIEPGGDVVENGRVIGSYFAQIELNGIPIRLVDTASPRTQEVRETLASEIDVLPFDLERRVQSLELMRLAFQSGHQF